MTLLTLTTLRRATRHRRHARRRHGRTGDHQWRKRGSGRQQLGACETGYGKRPGNRNHANSSYVSAFGIQRGLVPRWLRRATTRWPACPHGTTPGRQRRGSSTATALMHYRLYGDGLGMPRPMTKAKEQPA